MGAAHETIVQSGYSHLMEHLVFKSTKNFPKNSIMDRVAEYGGNINAYTDHESTCFYINISKEYLIQAIEILAELVKNANFSESEFISEKNVVIEELKQYRNDPEDFFIESIPAYVDEDCHYAKPIIGLLPTLEKATSDDLRRFYKAYYIPQNAFLCISGNFDSSALPQICQSYIGDWCSEAKVKKNKTHQKQKGKDSSHDLPRLKALWRTKDRVKYIPQSVSKQMVAFILPDLADHHPFSQALHLINMVFAIGQNSRLYQNLYTQKHLVDHIKTTSLSGIYDGMTLIVVYPRKDSDIPQIVDIFTHEFHKLLSYDISTDELEFVKKQLINSSRYVYEYMEVLAQSLGEEEILGDYLTFFDYEQDIQKVTKADISRLLSSYYHKDIFQICLTGGKKLYDTLGISNKNIKMPYKVSQNDGVSQTTLPNGLKVLLKKSSEKSICGISLAIRSSQIDENAQTLGYNQLTSSLLLYGNARRDYQQCLSFCTKFGIQASVSHGKETTKLNIKCFSENLYESLELLHDFYFTPTFDDKHFKNLRENFISNILRIQDFPQSEAVYLWKKMIFGKHSNLVSRDGSIQTLSKAKCTHIKSWYAEKIIGAGATLCIVGDFDLQKTLDCIWDLFHHGTFDVSQQHRPIEVAPSLKTKITKNKGLDQSIINLGGFCMPGKDLPRRGQMCVLSQIIGGDISSRMFDIFREKHGISYQADFDFEMLTDIGYYNMFLIVDKKAENFAIDLLKKMLSHLQATGATPLEIVRAKSYIIGQMKIDQESVLMQANTLSSLLTLGFDYDFYLRRAERIENVKNDDILHILNDYFHYCDQYLQILH
jgi:predicted Zn-dependent peptidase